jgi:hypothetical protein
MRLSNPSTRAMVLLSDIENTVVEAVLVVAVDVVKVVAVDVVKVVMVIVVKVVVTQI